MTPTRLPPGLTYRGQRVYEVHASANGCVWLIGRSGSTRTIIAYVKIEERNDGNGNGSA